MELALVASTASLAVLTGSFVRKELRVLRVEWRVRRGLRAMMSHAG